MPRFDIQQQQSVISQQSVSPNAFGGGGGAAAASQVFDQLSNVFEQKVIRDERLKLQKDLTQASIDWTERQQELEQEYPDGEGMVEAFEKDFQKFNKDFLQNYKGRSREEAELRLLDLQGRLQKNLIVKQSVKKSQAEVASFEQDRDVIANKVSDGNMDAQFAMSLLQGRSDAMTALNPSLRGDIRQDNENIIGQSHVYSVLQNEGALAADDELKSDFLKGLSPSVRQSVRTKIEARARVDVREALSDASRSFQAGYPVGDLSDEIAIAKRFGLDEEVEDLRSIQRLEKDVNAFNLKKTTDQVKELRELNNFLMSGKGDDESLTKLLAYQSAFKNKKDMLKDDPYSWIEKSNYWDVPIIDADVSGDMSESIEQRRSIKQKILENEGVKIPLFRPEEISQLVLTMKQASPEDQIAILTNVTSQINPNEIGITAQQIAPKSVEMGAAMVNVQYAPDVARDILQGRKRDIPTPSDDAFNQEFLNTVGSAIEDETARQQALAAIQAVYKENLFKTAGSKDIDKTILDNDLFERSVEQVVGPVVEVRNNKTLSFRTESGAYVTSDEFEDVIDDATEELIMQTHGDVPRMESGQPLDVERMFKRMKLVAIGDGLYMIKDQNGNHAKTEDGQVFELNMRELRKVTALLPPEIMTRGVRGRRGS